MGENTQVVGACYSKSGAMLGQRGTIPPSPLAGADTTVQGRDARGYDNTDEDTVRGTVE